MIVTRVGPIPDDCIEIECSICGTSMLVDERDIKIDVTKTKLAVLMTLVVNCPICGMSIPLEGCVDVSC